MRPQRALLAPSLTLDLSQRALELAVRLALDDVDFVVVGGTARSLLGGDHAPRDLDVVVRDLGPVLRSAGRLGATTRKLHSNPVRLTTCLGPLDVFVGNVSRVRTVTVDGVDLRVAG